MIEHTCGECEHFDGEECQGKFEGSEMFDGSIACEEFEMIEHTVAELTELLAKAQSVIVNQRTMLASAKMHEGMALDRLKLLEDKKHARFNDDECWIFDQDDVESNHLESLVCPVVVKPDYLLHLLDSLDREMQKTTELSGKIALWEAATRHIG